MNDILRLVTLFCISILLSGCDGKWDGRWNEQEVVEQDGFPLVIVFETGGKRFKTQKIVTYEKITQTYKTLNDWFIGIKKVEYSFTVTTKINTIINKLGKNYIALSLIDNDGKIWLDDFMFSRREYGRQTYDAPTCLVQKGKLHDPEIGKKIFAIRFNDNDPRSYKKYDLEKLVNKNSMDFRIISMCESYDISTQEGEYLEPEPIPDWVQHLPNKLVSNKFPDNLVKRNFFIGPIEVEDQTAKIIDEIDKRCENKENYSDSICVQRRLYLEMTS
jgi:hypothetical protein